MSEYSTDTATTAQPRTERGLERVIFFSDAVVAIAITLIVLPLVDSAREVEHSTTSKFLSDNIYTLIAAAVTFAVIGVFWRDHHRLFERATGYTPLLVRTNMLWLLGIVALPLATVLDEFTHRDRLALGIYLGVIVFTMVMLRLEELLLYRANLLSDPHRATSAELVTRWLQVAAAFVALIIAVTWPEIGLWALLLLAVTGPLETFLQQRIRTNLAS
ncbi:TMEM175 family protein [Nocardia jiangxiensis]|uniref:TMEM175 family protein n=1 Tax=Nocardia jiangxiensis TaxID=282685 RepID=A0ABW6S4C8_9NOCA|nr:TMEM175 family protein [Nocardia jiangxiensis]